MFNQKAPDFSGAVEWINTRPLSIKGLAGKVVIVDFWTYTCVNCIRTLPHMRELWNKYKDNGLLIVGVHTPEFEFEKETTNVKEAVKKLKIKYPVAVDSNYEIWKAYNNKYWPRQYIIDTKGYIQWDHIGEGGEEEIEEWIVKLLGEINSKIKVEIKNPKKSGDMGKRMSITPETYAGHARSNGLGNGAYCETGSCDNYKDPGNHTTEKIYLDGKWVQEEEYLKHEGKDGYVAFRYNAKEVNAVLKSFSGKPYEVKLTLDGENLTSLNKGKDVKLAKDGRSYIVVEHPDIYNLAIAKEFGNHDLKMITDSNDFMLFAFTFG